MQSKLTETLAAILAIVLIGTLLTLALHSEGAWQLARATRGMFVEDLDDIAPGPRDPIPVDGIAQWISSDDYPLEALRNEWQGTTAIEWTIDRRGHVVDCRIVSSSGHRVLDDAACGAITSRGRYTPARDAQGHRTEGTMRRRVVWRLPH